MASLTLLLALLVTLTCLAGSGSAWRVSLYRDTNHQGGHIDMSGKGCKNVPGDFNDRTSSVNTHGGCVRLYQNAGCTGKSVEVFPGSGGHSKLSSIGFNDRTSAVGNCPGRNRRAAAFNSFQI